MDQKDIMRIFEETAYVRTGGSPEELRAAEYIAGECKRFGGEAVIEPFAVDMATIEEAIFLADGQEIPCKGYLCAGKPILAAADEAVQEMVRESGCGIAVPPGDDEALARAMEQVLREPQRFRAMGDSGRKFYEQNYTTQVFMEHLLNILQHYAEKGV